MPSPYLRFASKRWSNLAMRAAILIMAAAMVTLGVIATLAFTAPVANACQPDFAHPGMCLSPQVPWEPNPPGDLPGGLNLPPQRPAPRGGCPLKNGCGIPPPPRGIPPDACAGNGYTIDGRPCGPQFLHPDP
jgi:hypothetical protein